jgi:sugar transferase (PEP-CTERM system associated)
MLNISNHHISRITVTLLILEITSAIGAVYLAAMIRLFGGASLDEISSYFLPAALMFAFSVIFSMNVFGMYHLNARERVRETLLRLMPSFALSVGVLSLIYYAIPSFYLDRKVTSLALIIAIVFITFVRILVFKTSESTFLRSRIIFLGTGNLAQQCHELAVTNEGHHEFDVIGFVPVDKTETSISSKYILPSSDSLFSLAKKHHADEIVVAVQDRRGGQLPIDDLLECKLNGVKVIDAAKFFEREACQIRVEWLQPGWLTFGGGFDQSFFRKFVKQIFDLLVSSIALLLALPLMLIIGICIYFEDRGSIFYYQDKVGLNGIIYTDIKFRSLEIDAENWAAMSFPQTTKIGKIIRRLRLDELPRIFNVLKGDMSFVGPCPERPHYVDELNKEVPFYNMRHSIKPGITGVAQVRRTYTASIEESLSKLQYDLYYVKNNSLFLDVVILLETVQVLLLGRKTEN